MKEKKRFELNFVLSRFRIFFIYFRFFFNANDLNLQALMQHTFNLVEC